jgi:hypothetical protein
VDGSNAELTFDGGDERWALKQSTSEGFERASELGFTARELFVQTNDTDILLSGPLLRFYETGCAVDADNKASSDLGVERSTVASLLYPVDVSTELSAHSMYRKYLKIRLIQATTS